MSEFFAKLSGERLISKRFPLHLTVESWDPWGGELDPFPGTIDVTFLVTEEGEPAQEFVTFTGELRRVAGFDEPFFVPDQSPLTPPDDPGPNALWVQFNELQEQEPFGPFAIPLQHDKRLFSIKARIKAPNHEFVTEFEAAQRPDEWILRVEPLSQQSSPPSHDFDRTWAIGDEIRKEFHSGAEWPNRQWGKVLYAARKGANWHSKSGSHVSFSLGTSGCSYLVTTMLLRYLRVPEPDDPGTLVDLFTLKIGRLFAAVDRGTETHYPRLSAGVFGKTDGNLGYDSAEIDSTTKIDGKTKKAPADKAQHWFPAQLAWLCASKGKDPGFTAARQKGRAPKDPKHPEKGLIPAEVEWYHPGRDISSNGWSSQYALVPPPWEGQGGLRKHLGLVAWDSSGVKTFKVSKHKETFQRQIRDALGDGLPVIGLFGEGGDHWCIIVGYRKRDDGSYQFVINDPGGWKHLQYPSHASDKAHDPPALRDGKALSKYVIVQPPDWTPQRTRRVAADWSLVDAPKD